MSKKSKIIILISLLVIIILSAVTYAFFIWRGTDTNITSYAECFDILYSKGNDVGSDQGAYLLMPSDDYTGGLSVTVKMGIDEKCNLIKAKGRLYLNTLDTTSSSLFDNGELKYMVLKNNKETGISGSIEEPGSIELNIGSLSKYDDVEDADEYTVYVWIDNEYITNDDVGAKYYGNISAEAIQYEEETTAAEYITNLYLDNKDGTATNNSIEYSIAPSVGLMNDRLGGTTENIDGGNIRYYGANPNNYVWLGDYYTEDMTIERGISEYGSFEECMENEGSSVYCQEDIEVHAGDKKLWRIIGVFDGKLKLVTDNIISTQGLSWDTSESSVNNGYGINEWSQSDLMKLLNPGYEEESVNNSLYWNKGTGTVYTTWRNGTTSNISFANTGLSESEKNMIEEATWYTGAYNTTSYADAHYKKERENMGKICSSGTYCNDAVTRTNEWNGKVGLISASDLGYSVDLNSCNKALNNYSNSDCANNNWLVNGTWYWTMSPRAHSDCAYSVFRVNDNGILFNIGAGTDASVRPAVYVKSGVSISGGNGSQSDPYELSY